MTTTSLTLGTTIAVLENDANSAPQAIFSTATLVNTTGDFDGGSIEVSGLLSQDTLSIINAGLVSTVGSSVLYDGTVVGTFTGGVGGDFTLTLNANATTAIVQELVRSIGYGNSSDTPTTSRTLHVNVTDGDGHDVMGPASLAQLSGAANPFQSFALSEYSRFAFLDFDGDGDMDLVASDFYGNISTLQNNGDGSFTALDVAADPFSDSGSYAGFRTPIAVDWDGDGDDDLVVGGNYNPTIYFENNGDGTFTRDDSQVSDVSWTFDPESVNAILDYDNDGDVDVLVDVWYSNTFKAFTNDGTGNFSEVTGAANPFNSIDRGQYYSTAVAVDWDLDGDSDLVMTHYDGSMHYVRNDNGIFTEQTGSNNPFNGLNFGYGYASTAFADIDGDGDLDMVVGNWTGQLTTFRNNATHGLNVTLNVTASDDAPTSVTDNGSTGEGASVVIDVLTNDTDPDGGDKFISLVNGNPASAGMTYTLASGALVTFNNDGTLTYNPNGQFDYLISTDTAIATGAENTSASDSFTYTLNGGSEATVVVFINGADGAGDKLMGNSDPYHGDAIYGTTGNDTIMGLEGDDSLYGLAGNDKLLGNGGSDFLAGAEGNDLLNGGKGIDDMWGGSGDDVYRVDKSGDLVNEFADAGHDTVISTTNFTLSDNVEDLKLVSTTGLKGTGNDLDNVIKGSGGDDILIGKAGNDILYGGDGFDILRGGDGDDVLESGSGSDRVTGGNGRDIFRFTDDDFKFPEMADYITDFSQADHDVIRLNLVDADLTTAGKQDLIWLGTGEFTGTAGELRFDQSSNMTVILIDRDGDTTADNAIFLEGTIDLTLGDLVL